MSILFKPESLKREFEIEFNVLGNSTLSNLEQPASAYEPISFTEFGMVTLVRLEQKLYLYICIGVNRKKMSVCAASSGKNKQKIK